MQRQFQIITDSGCDLPNAYFQEKGVECLRLGFVMGGVEYYGEAGQDISLQAFYSRLRAGELPTTYQITPEVAREHIEPYMKTGQDVLIVAFSSGLSGTANSYGVAAKALLEEYPDRKIFVLDSLCASMGQGLLLHYVIEKADMGATIEETYEYAEDLKRKIDHEFTVNDLFHLKRGGRVSSTAAVVGSMLNVKPILHVSNEGKLTSTGKVMGRKKALKRLVENMVELADITDKDPIYISHADCADDAKTLAEMVKKSFPENKIVIEYIGPVIGSHSGCGTVALFFKAKRRIDK